MAMPVRKMPKVNSSKLALSKAWMATSAPMMPNTLPMTNTFLRPSFCIKNAAGKVARIKPKNCEATGAVTKAGWLANCLPIKADTATSKMLPVVSKAWAKAKPQTVYGMVEVFLFEAGIIGDVAGLGRFTGRLFGSA